MDTPSRNTLFRFYTTDGEAFNADIATLSAAFRNRYPGLPEVAYSPNAITFSVITAGIAARWAELDVPGTPSSAPGARAVTP